MSFFKLALADVLHHEGGLSNHKIDRGGATAFGISLRFLKSLPDLEGDVNNDGHVTKEDIYQLSKLDAERFYKKYFWTHYRLNEIEHQDIAIKLMNFFVNMRGKTAARIAQKAANDLGADLVEDGVLGSKSFEAMNALNTDQFLVCIKYQAWNVYRSIVANDKSQVIFINGWRKRAFS